MSIDFPEGIAESELHLLKADQNVYLFYETFI